MKFWNRLRYLGRRGSMERDLEEELRPHPTATEEQLMREGMTREQARAAATQSSGNMTREPEDNRSIWNVAWLESLAQDIRYAFRSFCRAPLFAVTVIVTIGLALGLNTVLFTGFNTYVLAPYAVQDPYGLYQFWWNTKTVFGRGMSWNEFQQFRRNNPAFSDVIAMQQVKVRLDSDMLVGDLVSGNYFSTLGVLPEVGRTLLPSDAVAAGTSAVLVLSYDCWEAKFAKDRSVIYRTISLHGHSFKIVGVARSGFSGISSSPRDFWVPITMSSQLLDGPDFFGPTNPTSLEVTGRLRLGLSSDQARTALLVFAKQLTGDRQDQDKAISVGLQSNATSFPLTPETIARFAPAFIAFGLVLLLACTNVANMMVARALSRLREIGVRLALGASRPRLVRQLLTEGFVLALCSAGFGFAIAWACSRYGVRAFIAYIPHEFAQQVRVAPISLDWRVFCYLLLAASISTLVFALAPALQASRVDLISAARGDFTAARHPVGRLRSALITVQVTICVMLLICSGILLLAGHHVEMADVGLNVHNVIVIDVRDGFRSNVAALLSSDPEVGAVAADWRAPLLGTARGISVAPEDASGFIVAGYNFVSPEHFDVFRIPVARGRNFTQAEARAEGPVVIVSESTAHKFWPETNAIGQVLRVQPPPLDSKPDKIPQYANYRVIGIARDAVNHSVVFGPEPSFIYFPTNANGPSSESFLVRVRGNTELAHRSVQKMLDDRAPGAVTQVVPMEQVLEIQYLPFHVFSWISETLSGLALILTIAGVYGVISYLVTQRSREIGIRIALGASSRAVMRLILSLSIRLVCLGLAIGTLLALVVLRILSSQISQVVSFDVRVFAVSIAVVLVAATVAAAIPARRASRLDVMSILRQD